jgi:hypothetical protein
MTFVAVRIVGASSSVACLSRNDEVDALLSAQGIDPSVVNTVRWPAYGATRWATATVMMHSTALDTAVGLCWNGGVAGHPTVFVGLSFGGLLFPQMTFGRTIPIVSTDASKAVFLVELHCRRWLWRNIRPRPPGGMSEVEVLRGYNVSRYSRDRTVARTLNGGSVWTPRQVVERVLLGEASQGFPPLQLSTDTYLGVVGSSTGLPLEDSTIPGFDFDGVDSAPGLIDATLKKSGAALLFVPGAAVGTCDIAIHPIATGEARCASYITSNGSELVAGGMETFTDSSLTSGWSSGAKRYAYANSGIVRKDCPQKIRVYFPYTLSDNADPATFPSGGMSACDTKFATLPSWETNAGRPFTTSADPLSPERYAILDDYPLTTKRSAENLTTDLIDGTERANRAEQVSYCYYARFKAGACDAWFRGARPLTAAVAWTGGLWWEWQIRRPDDLLPYATHVYGFRNDDLFGFEPLEGENPIRGFGSVTAFRGPDGRFRVIGNLVGHVPAMIRIKGSTVVSTNVWSYSAKVLQRDGTGWSEWADITARNAVERNNTAIFAGPSVKLPLTSAPDFLPLPIGTDRDGLHTDIDVPAFIVEDRTLANDPIAVFGLPNTVDGDCPTADLIIDGEDWT